MNERGRTEAVCRRVAPSRQGAAARACDWGGCALEGLYRAPRSRVRLKDYWWFCLEHVREYNAAWNYYAGMTEAEVEADVRRDTVWQRPTWPLGKAGAFNPHFRWMDDGLDEPQAAANKERRRTLSPMEQALLILDLTPPVTVAVVKAQYKLLVKRYHPDANGGDKAAEEQFKVISEAYRTVMSGLSA